METESSVSLASVQGVEHHHPIMGAPLGHEDRLIRIISLKVGRKMAYFLMKNYEDIHGGQVS